jgi:hypothetical protein
MKTLASFLLTIFRNCVISHMTQYYCSNHRSFLCILFSLFFFVSLHLAVPSSVLWRDYGARLGQDLPQKPEWLNRKFIHTLRVVNLSSTIMHCGKAMVLREIHLHCTWEWGCLTALLLFTGGSLCGLFCATLHPAQVWSGSNMYPFPGS